MMKRFLFSLLALPTLLHAQTLEALQQAARANYPVIKQYDLIRQTASAALSSLDKAWLPQLQATAQGTVQSDVAALPQMLQDLMRQQGVSVNGLGRTQYRVGLDVTQQVYDGGATQAQKAVARSQEAVSNAQADVDLYAVRQRVNDLFFGALLVEERISVNRDVLQLLQSNEEKLAAMHRRGTATAADANAVRAERLGAEQLMVELQSGHRALLRMLQLLCGVPVEHLERPQAVLPAAPDVAMQRPELQLFDAQLRLADAQEQQLQARLMPRLSLFATGFYGYPGYDMFHDMLHRDATLNGLVGARLTWSIGSLYTHRADKARLQAQRSLVDVQRQTFLFNNQLQQAQQTEDVERYRQLLRHDDEIVQLRTSVRQAAESKLGHGIIDVSNLLQEITREHQARTDRSLHEIEMLRHIYDLKHLTNN